MKKLMVGVCAAVAAAVSFAGSFEVSNDGGESWTAYETLNAAVAAAEDKGIVELTADATWSGEITIEDKRVTIRSRGETRRVLTRTSSGALFHLRATAVRYPDGSDRYVDKVNDCPAALGADLCLANVIVDGGAVWLEPEDPASTANSGLSGGALADAKGASPSYDRLDFATVTLMDGATVRNFNQSAYLLGGYIGSFSGVRIFEGAEIIDCRGDKGLYTDYGHTGYALVRMSGGTITRCSSATTALFYLEIRTEESSHTFTGGAITNNAVVDTANGTIFVQPNQALANSVLGIGGGIRICDNYAMSGESANVVLSTAKDKDKWRRYLAIVEPLTTDACVWASMAGDDLSTVMGVDKVTPAVFPTPNVDKIVYDRSPVDGYLYVGANAGEGSTDLVWTKGAEYVRKSTHRYSTDGGATWTESSLPSLDDCAGIFGATAAAAEDVGSAEDRIVELLADTKLTKVLGVNKSFTLRSGEGGPYKLTINSNASTIDAGFMPYAAVQSEMAVVVSNIVLDGGVFWKNAFDVTKPFADNIASYNPPKGGTVFNTSSYGGTLVFGEGAEIRNFSIARGSGFVFAGTGYNNKVVVKPGAVFHDNRGYGPMIEVGASKATYGRADLDFAGEIYNCANAYGDGEGASEKCYGMIATYSANDASYATADTAASTVFVTAGGSIHHCQSVYGGGFSFCRIGDRFNSPAVLFKDISITDNRVALGGGAVWAFHMNKLDETSGSGIIRFDGKVTMKDNYQVNFEDGRSVRNSFDNEHYRPIYMDPASYYQFVRIQPTLDPMSEIGFFAGEYSLESKCYTSAIQRSASAQKCSFASLVGDPADTSLLACIKNEIFPELDCAVIGSLTAGDDKLNYLSWTQGPGYVAPEEDAAEVYMADGTLVGTYKTFREAYATATGDNKSKKTGTVVKLLKDGVIGGVCINTGYRITLTSDKPVTVWTHAGVSGDFYARSDAAEAGLCLAGQVAWRRAVVADDVGTLLSSLFKGNIWLKDQAKVYGVVKATVASNYGHVEGAPLISGNFTVSSAAALILTGPLTGDLPVNNTAAKTLRSTFATVAEDYLEAATMSDAHHFKNANDAGLCGGLFDVEGVPTLQWMRCAVTIQDDGTVDTYNYDGDLALGESYAFTVNASADYLNSKVGRKGVYPLIRAASLTGKPTLVLPEGLDYRWVAREVYDGDTLIGYDLVRNGPGLMLFVN